MRRSDPRRRWPPLLVVGLTGGAGAGKSTIAGLFARLGAAVIEADALGREVVAPGEPALAELIAAFGGAYLRPDGTLDRLALGRRIFARPADRAILNRITHPRIGALLQERLGALQKSPPESRVVVVEAAVLIEGGWVQQVDRVVVVRAQQSLRLSRLTGRLQGDERLARAVLRSQLPERELLKHADLTLRGDLPLPKTETHVRLAWNHLRSPARTRNPRGEGDNC